MLPLLDHVFVSVPSDGYRTAAESPFLRDRYAYVKVKNARSSIGGSYSSVGIAGTNTLLELFDAAAAPLAGITSGLVFSFDVAGTLQTVRRELGDGAEYQLVERTVDGRTVPWYHLLRPDLGGGPFTVMLAEVTPQYYAHLGAVPDADGRMTRRGYLDAALGRTRTSGPRQLTDYTELTLRLHDTTAKRLVALLEQLGFVTEDPYLLIGADADVRIQIDDTAVEGVVGVRTELGIGWVGPPEEFGSDCRLDGAGWTFSPLAAG